MPYSSSLGIIIAFGNTIFLSCITIFLIRNGKEKKEQIWTEECEEESYRQGLDVYTVEPLLYDCQIASPSTGHAV